MRIIKIVSLCLFAAFFFGLPLLAWIMGPSTYNDVKPVKFDSSFFVPQTNDRSEQIKNWYQSRNIGTSLIGMRNSVDAKLFNSVDTQTVVSGREPGWLFYKQQFDNCPTSTQITDVFDRIDSIHMLYEAASINFGLAVAPNKSAIYPEHAPSWGDYTDCLQKTNQMLQFEMAIPNRGVIDVLPPLLAAKEYGQVYYSADTHWNRFGYEVGLDYMLGNIFNRPYLSPSKIGENLSISTSEAKDADLSRQTRIDYSEPELNLEFKPMRPHPAVKNLNGPVFVLKDSFLDLQISKLKLRLPQAKFVHISKLEKNLPEFTSGAPLPKESTVLVETVQRFFISRFAPNDVHAKRPGKQLLLNAVATNLDRAASCSFRNPKKLKVTTKFTSKEATHDAGTNFETSMQSGVYARIPVSSSEDLTCIRLRFNVQNENTPKGNVFFEAEEQGFRRGLRFPVSPTKNDNNRELRFILPKKMQGRQIRFDPRIGDGEILNFTIEASPYSDRQ